jgi:hypothetical protein
LSLLNAGTNNLFLQSQYGDGSCWRHEHKDCDGLALAGSHGEADAVGESLAIPLEARLATRAVDVGMLQGVCAYSLLVSSLMDFWTTSA